jgi:hypothetical protein
MVPTVTTGLSPLATVKSVSHTLERQSEIISSATSRESVSFHLPLKSVTVSVSRRVTFLLPHPTTSVSANKISNTFFTKSSLTRFYFILFLHGNFEFVSKGMPDPA